MEPCNEVIPLHPDTLTCPYCGASTGELEELDQALADAVEACNAKSAALEDARDLIFRFCGARTIMEFRRLVEGVEVSRLTIPTVVN